MYDKNAYVWDVYTIFQEAGLEDLLSDPNMSLRIMSTFRFTNPSLAGYNRKVKTGRK